MLAPRMTRERDTQIAALALGAAAALFALLLFARLGHPLFWADEAETAVFGQRILQFGYPTVHDADGNNALYLLWPRWRAAGIGIHEPSDAYTGSPWLQYYVAALGVALASGADGFTARSAWVRLPFAALGCAGLALVFMAVGPALARERARRLRFAALYALLLCASVSLQLHLREVRHYPLNVLGCGAFTWVFLRRHAHGTLGFAGYGAGLAASWLWLFHSFHPASLALGAAAALWLAARAWRRPEPLGARARWWLREAAPLAGAVLVTLPLLGFFDFFQQTETWVELFGDPARTLRNARFLLVSLLRHEWLLPVLALRGAAWWLARAEGAPPDPLAGARRASASFLSLAVAVYAPLVSNIPFLFERYFVSLGPLLCALLLVDLATLQGAARGLQGAARNAARAGLVIAGACAVAALALRLPELSGRLAEIRDPYKGPLDYVIPYLAERYPDPSKLVIASNYEAAAYMFYLGSRATVDFYGQNLPEDASVAPDVIVPRPWPDHLDVLRALASQGSFEEHRFPVANLRWNNTPSLAPRVGARYGHLFHTPVPGVEGPELVILERTVER
jgi:hypothetical protein